MMLCVKAASVKDSKANSDALAWKCNPLEDLLQLMSVSAPAKVL